MIHPVIIPGLSNKAQVPSGWRAERWSPVFTPQVAPDCGYGRLPDPASAERPGCKVKQLARRRKNPIMTSGITAGFCATMVRTGFIPSALVLVTNGENLPAGNNVEELRRRFLLKPSSKM